MAASLHKLQELQEHHRSSHAKSANTKLIKESFDLLINSLQRVQDILGNPNQYEAQELENALQKISHIFRTVKFSTVLVPILEQLSTTEGHREYWETAKIEGTKDPVTVNSFRGLGPSAAPIKDHYGENIEAQRKRELRLLGIYNISMITIGIALTKTKKTSPN